MVLFCIWCNSNKITSMCLFLCFFFFNYSNTPIFITIAYTKCGSSQLDGEGWASFLGALKIRIFLLAPLRSIMVRS